MSDENSSPSVELWTCPNCERKFLRKNQVHSCKKYPVEKHFERKDFAKTLYEGLKSKIEEHIGSFYVESLPCCIHLVTYAYTFAAVYALRDKMRIHFTLKNELKNKRIDNSSRMSKNHFLHSIDIKGKEELDEELISWLREAYNMKKQEKNNITEETLQSE